MALWWAAWVQTLDYFLFDSTRVSPFFAADRGQLRAGESLANLDNVPERISFWDNRSSNQFVLPLIPLLLGFFSNSNKRCGKSKIFSLAQAQIKLQLKLNITWPMSPIWAQFLPLSTSFSWQVGRELVGQARQACLLFCGLSFELIKYESYIKARDSELEIRLAPSQAGTSLELEPKN